MKFKIGDLVTAKKVIHTNTNHLLLQTKTISLILAFKKRRKNTKKNYGLNKVIFLCSSGICFEIFCDESFDFLDDCFEKIS